MFRQRALEPYRNELMICVRAEASIGPAGLAAEIERRPTMYRARLARYQRLEQCALSTSNPSRSDAVALLILKLGMMNESTWIDGSMEALGVLRQAHA